MVALFALALTTGMRPSEYLALKWSDIDWATWRGQRFTLRFLWALGPGGPLFDDTKRKRSRRVVKLQGFVIKALEELRGRQVAALVDSVQPDLIFRALDGSPLRQRRVKREFWRVLDAAELKQIRLYDLCHAAATLAVAAGVSVKVISEQLGHHSGAVLARSAEHSRRSCREGRTAANWKYGSLGGTGKRDMAMHLPSRPSPQP